MKLREDQDSFTTPQTANSTTAGDQRIDPFQYLSLITDNIQQGAWVIDLRGNISYANRQMAELLGTTAVDMKDKPIFDFLSTDNTLNLLHLINSQKLLSDNPIEFKYRKVTGEDCWLRVNLNPLKDDKGNLIGTVALHSEIPKQYKEDNNVASEDMGVILDSVKDYAIMMVDRDHQVLSWNVGAKVIFGYDEYEIIGKKVDVLFTENDNRNNAPEAELITALKIGHSYDDRWHMRKDGSVFFASGVMTRLNEDGQSTKFLKIARDWTDRKKLEEMLKKADRHKNEFLATLAHELRNPLASILSGIEVLKQDPDNGKMVHTREIIERQVQQMIHLVNDLLDISRISLGKIKLSKHPMNVLDAVHLALETSHVIIQGYKHALEVSLPSGPIIVDGDMTRLSQVFLNILINSAKYTAPSGKIILEVNRENEEVVIRVKDNGMGIPKDMLSSIFEMFEQIQDRSEYPQAGLGIGLSVVKQLVEMHGGHVGAYSAGSNLGSEFIVTLPISKNKYVPAEKNEAIPLPVAHSNVTQVGKKRILLIDDNADAADMMGILLKKRGYSVKKAYDGESGIATALEFNPDIVILDLGLPDISGYDVLKAMKEIPGRRFYLALSGWGQEEDLIKSKNAGFNHHFVKPIDIQSLDEILLSANELN